MLIRLWLSSEVVEPGVSVMHGGDLVTGVVLVLAQRGETSEAVVEEIAAATVAAAAAVASSRDRPNVEMAAAMAALVAGDSPVRPTGEVDDDDARVDESVDGLAPYCGCSASGRGLPRSELVGLRARLVGVAVRLPLLLLVLPLPAACTERAVRGCEKPKLDPERWRAATPDDDNDDDDDRKGLCSDVGVLPAADELALELEPEPKKNGLDALGAVDESSERSRCWRSLLWRLSMAISCARCRLRCSSHSARRFSSMAMRSACCRSSSGWVSAEAVPVVSAALSMTRADGSMNVPLGRGWKQMK